MTKAERIAAMAARLRAFLRARHVYVFRLPDDSAHDAFAEDEDAAQAMRAQLEKVTGGTVLVEVYEFKGLLPNSVAGDERKKR